MCRPSTVRGDGGLTQYDPGVYKSSNVTASQSSSSSSNNTSAAPSSVTSASEHRPSTRMPALRPAMAASRLGAMTTHRAGSGSRAGICRPRVPPAPPMPPPKLSGTISIDARASCSAWGHGSAGAVAGQGVGFKLPTGFGLSSQIQMDGVPASAASPTKRSTPGRALPSDHLAALLLTKSKSSGRSWLRSIVVPLFLCFMSRLRNSCCRWRRRALRLKPVAHASNVMYCSSCRCILGLIRQKASPYNGTTAFMWFAVMLCPLVCAEYGTGLTGAPYATRCLGCFV